MGVIFTHGIPHDTGALSVGPVVPDPQLMHVIKNPALDRLKSVPCIRQCSGNNYTHGIINIRFLHHLRVLGFYDFFFHFFLLPEIFINNTTFRKKATACGGQCPGCTVDVMSTTDLCPAVRRTKCPHTVILGERNRRSWPSMAKLRLPRTSCPLIAGMTGDTKSC